MPTSLLDKIRTALRRPASTVPQLADALADARRAEADALAAVEKQAVVLAEGFLDSEAKRAADRDALAAARVAAEDVAVVLAEVERRHAAALDVEEQARRAGLYASAKVRAAEAAADLARDYPAIVKGALKMLRSLAEAQRDVETANAQLPRGAEPIDDPEQVVRGRPFRPQEVIAETEVVLWTRHDAATPVDEPYQSEIQEAAQGWGHHPNHDEPNYLRVRYLRREVRQHVQGFTPSPLAAALRLPALKSEGMAWGAPDPTGVPSATLLAVMAGNARPDSILAKMAELNEAPPVKSTVGDPEVRVEWEMLGYEGPIPLKPAPYKHYHSTADENPNPRPEANPRPIGSDLVGLPGLQRPSLAALAPRNVQPDGRPTRAGTL